MPCCGIGLEHSPDRSHGRGAIASGIFCQAAIASVFVEIHEPPASCTAPVPLACNRAWKWRQAVPIMLLELRLKLGDLLLRLLILLQEPIQLSISSLLARHRKLQKVFVEQERPLTIPLAVVADQVTNAGLSWQTKSRRAWLSWQTRSTIYYFL